MSRSLQELLRKTWGTLSYDYRKKEMKKGICLLFGTDGIADG